MTALPIDLALPELKDTLRSHRNAVLIAPPGAGKTTRVPLAFLTEPWMGQKRILMLEPRRLAARSAARYMSESLGEKVGETVGYRVKMDTRVGLTTRIEVITEGVLTRLLQSDPALEDVGMIIFDEFHERSLHADLGLALCLESQSVLRDDLRILVMSATLEAEPVAQLLNNAPVIISEGRSFPVETFYLDRPADKNLEAMIVRRIVQAWEHHTGDIMVFLPGAGEIRRVEQKLRQLGMGEQAKIAPLYGSLSQEAQNDAIARSDTRKIVLATSIAETSVTVEGIEVVIDSGLMRVSRFSPRTGMTRLETIPVSLASADQRRGRAGRLRPGVCYRMWTEYEHSFLLPKTRPEIYDADLVPLALELAVWGIADPMELRWLDLPPEAAFSQARQLLKRLGALDENGKVTAHGRRLAELGLHPRLGHMIEKAIPLGLGGLACEIAAIAGERDFIRGLGSSISVDFTVRVEVLRKSASHSGFFLSEKNFVIDEGMVHRIRAEANQLKKAVGIDTAHEEAISACGLLLAFAFPDRIGQRRGDKRFLLSGGRGAYVEGDQQLAASPFLVAIELDDKGADSRIYLACAIQPEEIDHHFEDQMTIERVMEWDSVVKAVKARERKQLGALVVKETQAVTPSPEEIAAVLLQAMKEEGLDILPWTKTARQLQQRLQFMHSLNPKWPNVSDEMLLTTLGDWLSPYLTGMSRYEDLQRLSLADILSAGLSWDLLSELDASAPTHITVPSGSRIPIDYSDPACPVLAVRLQELFGLLETPRIVKGRVPLTLHLLSPAHRPVQITRDLASFWRTTYFEVKKDLKGRYPKHYWPDDPLIATPTNQRKNRSTP